MKMILKDGRRYVLRFDKGEELFAGLSDFLSKEAIQACVFNAIGSVYELEMGFYNAHLKEYRRKPIYEELEIASLTGNGAITDGKPAIHMHGVFGNNEFASYSGHVFKLIVLATCEVFLIKLDGGMQRQNNPDWNLNLLA